MYHEICGDLVIDIKRLMIKSGLNKENFAKAIGISPLTLNRFLKGEEIYLPSIQKIIKYLEKEKSGQ